ncbi:putative membrane protein [Mycobacterium xenopi 3993]|nr:putative membrane protein [Mycobacterium xenopi 3993]
MSTTRRMLISTLVGVALAVNVAALQPAQAGADPALISLPG